MENNEMPPPSPPLHPLAKAYREAIRIPESGPIQILISGGTNEMVNSYENLLRNLAEFPPGRSPKVLT